MPRLSQGLKSIQWALAAMLVLAGLSLAQAQQLPASARKAGFIAVEKTVKTYSATTLSGDAVNESSFGGDLALIYFWSSKNDPQAAGIANIGKIKMQFPNIRFLVLTQESPDLVRPMIGEASMYPYIIAGAKQAILAFGTPSAPSWIFLKPDGTIIAVRNGKFDPSSPGGIEALAAMALTFLPGKDSAAGETIPASAASSTATAPAAGSFATKIEIDVVTDLNLARTNPKAYAQLLREYRKLIRGNYLERPGEITILLNEGVKAVDEAIAFLERQAALPALSLSRGLSLSAGDHARDQGQSGATGHSGRDGSTMSQRIERYGQWQKTIGENIAYGPSTGRDIVLQLIVDDGVASRGHRANIFNPGFLTVGISYGPHAKYGSVCVQDFAGGFIEE